MNHFPGMYNLHRKSNLAKNLTKMRDSFPDFYNFFPKTYVLPSENKDLALEFGITTNQSHWTVSGKYIKEKKKNNSKDLFNFNHKLLKLLKFTIEKYLSQNLKRAAKEEEYF